MDKIQKELKEVQKKLADIERTQENLMKIRELERMQDENKCLSPRHEHGQMM